FRMAEASAQAQRDGCPLILIQVAKRPHQVEPFSALPTFTRQVLDLRLEFASTRVQEFPVGNSAYPAAEGPAPPGRKEGCLRDVVAVRGGAGEAARERAHACLVAGDKLAESLPVVRHGGLGQIRFAG